MQTVVNHPAETITKNLEKQQKLKIYVKLVKISSESGCSLSLVRTNQFRDPLIARFPLQIFQFSLHIKNHFDFKRKKEKHFDRTSLISNFYNY